ncbi:carboxypeptidase regulatory-like domain-containing protein [Halodesulfurarchaeum sp. HSR-GB]|uniref:carboxypeptidase-like regulatory domain-containing protein n=1 Tax=Halodesulfurarchaeum sp. HSR-GB TaxID=3074077 RepID=UPI002864C162|nr:carboxypeptidase regulatory-like domain-containing protein [Halodesulfurarchaeum sp. HSR-GB]MDR5657756.1 carboxypeptidase regulatory-like domain-containing protein [Halodesulfurarchaeum sp. HSR-GB]
MPNDNSGIPSGTATSRSECRCPDCLSYEGLKEIPKTAQLYDNPVDAILHASQCANDACSTGKVDPKIIGKQIDKDELKESEPLIDFEEISLTDHLKAPRKFIRSTSWKVIGIVFLFVISAIFGTLGGLGGGSGIVEAGDSYDGIESTDGTAPEAVYEDGNWTIYRSGDSYIVSGSIDGSVVFLTHAGEVTDSPYRFNNSTAAKEAIALWRARNDKLPSEYLMPEATDALTNQTNWKVFSYNGSNIVAGKIDGKPVFLHPNGEFSAEPYFYNIRGVAEQSILYWVALSQTNNLPLVEEITKSELQNILSNWDSDGEKYDIWNSTDIGNWTVYTNGSAYVAAASIDNETVFLQHTGTIPTSVNYFDSPTALLEALNTWRSNNSDLNPAPISHDPGLGKEWELIDNQDAIEDDLTSDKLTTIDNDSLGSGSGTTIAGTVKNTNDQPVPDATVTLHSNPQITITDSNGGFVFTDVPEGDHMIHVAPPDGTDLAAPRNTSVSVSAEGEVIPQNDPDNVLYFENDDGSISQNRLTFLAQKKQPIEVRGGGSEVSSTIQVANPSNIDDLEVSLIPEYMATQQSTTFSGSDVIETLEINGSTVPEDQSIQLLGEITSEQETVRGTYTGWPNPNFEANGNLNVSDATATITPQAYTENKSWTGTTQGTTISVDPNSILQPSGGSLNLEPQITTQDRSNEGYLSGNGIRVYNPGNAQTEAEITITGKEGLYTVESGGVYESYDSSGSQYQYASHSGYFKFSVWGKVHKYGYGSAKSEIIQGPLGRLTAYTRDNGYASFSDSKWMSISNGQYLGKNYVHLNAIGYGDDPPHWVDFWGYSRYKLEDNGETGRVTLNYNGKSAKTSYLRGGDTDTVSIKLDPGWNEIPVSYSGDYHDISVSADFTAKSYPEDVSASIDGTQLFSHSGPLKNPQPIDISDSAIGTDEANLGLQTGTEKIDYKLDITARNTTMDPSLAVGNQTVFLHSGPLMQSQKVDLPTNDLTLGTNELDFTSSAGSLNYTINYTARTVPENVTVQVGSQTYTYPRDFSDSGPLPHHPNGEPNQINISALSLGGQTVSVSSNPIDGINTSVDATLIYDSETKQSYQPEIIVEKPDGTRYSKEIPDSALENGKLISPHNMTIPAHWLGTGENKIIVRTADASVVSAKVTTAGLKYQNKSLTYGG